MRNDHDSLALPPGRYPTADEVERAMRAARRLRAETVAGALRSLFARIAGLRWPASARGVAARPC